MARRVFYSFYYKADCQRAAQVRQIGSIDGNRPATDNEWEGVTRGKDPAIKRWIKDQMSGKSCTVVLVGSATANRKWINYEIVESWNSGMGIVGVRIHSLKNLYGETSLIGENPFDYVESGSARQPLSSFVKCHNPPGATSKDKYAWIANNLVR